MDENLYKIIGLLVTIAGAYLLNSSFLYIISFIIGILIIKDLMKFDNTSERILLISLSFLLISLVSEVISYLPSLIAEYFDIVGYYAFFIIFLASIFSYIYYKLKEK